jgi:perosamine synthetase
VKDKFISYSQQHIDEEDIASVVEVLRSDWLTTGPKISEFEEAVASYVGARRAVAVSSGTAALHCAMYALDIESGDEVIVPSITFAATANCVVYVGGKPVFADVEPGTLLIDPDDVERKITKKTRAIIAVDYAGHPCDYDRLKEIADRHSIFLVSDSCHALGAEYQGKKCGTISDLSVFSFHPVKHITTGEGGMITTDNPEYARRMGRFRNHGISADHARRKKQGTWYYEMVDLGFNYRITDFQCALGISQMAKLPGFLERRQEIAALYDEAFNKMPGIKPLDVSGNVNHAYHLYVIRVLEKECGRDRGQIFNALRDAEIGANVHYIPVHLHPYYQERYATKPGMCPVAERAYEEILSLPIHPSMTKADVDRVVSALEESMGP